MGRFILLITVVGLVCAGCSEVKPWDRDLLAEKRMQPVPSALDSGIDEHIYFSKEASSGGQGIGGGGCGCN